MFEAPIRHGFGQTAITPPDLGELQRFYRSAAGSWVARLMTDHVRALWPDVAGAHVAGLGYPVPLFDGPLAAEAGRVSFLMPARQGVRAWPEAPALNRSLLVNEDMLPLRDQSIDRLLVMHALEASERPRDLLREAWRCLRPEGRLLLVIPNRRGVWARFDHTPFGHGHPYSRGQLERLLTSSLFTAESWVHALYVAPVESRVVLRSARLLESVGRRLSPAFSGLILVAATKQLYAPVPKGKPMRVRTEFDPVTNGVVVSPTRSTPRRQIG